MNHFFPHDWLIPQWDAPANVRALCTTRQGGVSVAPFDSMNLGAYVDDVPQHVQHNRQYVQQVMHARPVFMHQVHGWHTLELHANTPDEQPADAAFTRESAVACVAMVADCLPVLLCDAQGRQVAAAHAGWRGLLGQAGQGVLESACHSFASLQSVGAGESTEAVDLIAWLGPCIGPSAFEVGPEVRQAFVAHDAQAHDCFVPSPNSSADFPKWLANLPALARQRLHALGVRRIFGNDASPAWCTVSNPTHYFSHRRDRKSGRFAAAVWLL